MKPELFPADLQRKPATLRSLADRLTADDPWAATPVRADSRIVLLGMGSSHYANAVAAARLRSRGVDATAVLASTDLLPLADKATVVVAVSASGGSAETLDALARYGDGVATVAVTNVLGSPITAGARAVIDMAAEPEQSGVSCRSFAHTLALLLALESRLAGGADVPGLLRTAADAAEDLLQSEDTWRPRTEELLIGPDGSHLAAPARRLSSAQQGALMLRETPRLPAVGCETGDWSHVDVYLTKTTDYRLVLFAGSRWEPQLLAWVADRGSTLVGIGGDVPGAAQVVRYPGDDDDDVRLLTEVIVAELLAASLWKPL
jgi:fructoselysine-6-P-deglycase FrlB-like protein